ncbi:MAG TPA: P-loop NTPase fold protein [Candidatus Babeliales bacterium]|nr:P-loop NTPase fold protein [Candidatus Babeliales bacterium]
MSIQLAREQILKFLNSDTNEVIAIKGNWGTGKTFIWNELLSEAKDSNQIALDTYSYVSLFGLNSIEIIRNRIFENQISKELIGKSLSDNISENTIPKAFHWLKKTPTAITNLISKIVNKKVFGSDDFIPFSYSLLYLFVNKSIICFDDIERKGKNITQNDILGLVSDLKYQKNCKLVLIFNDAAFSDEDKKNYEELREKVIDKEIHFDPTTDECISIAYKSINDKTNFNTITDLCNKLKINNIRIIFKIIQLANDLIKPLEDYPDTIKYQALCSLVLYTYCYYYNKGDFLPNFEQLKTINYTYLNDPEKKDKAKWVSTLIDYGYTNTDSFDLVIHNGVKYGYFDKTELLSQADILKDQITKSDAQGAFHKAWQLFHGSFKDNNDEVINALYNAFKNNCENLSIIDLDSTVKILRQLNESDKANALIGVYFNKNEQRLLKNSSNISIQLSGPLDTKISDSISSLLEKNKDYKKIEDIFITAGTKESFSREDELRIKNTSEDDIYGLLKNLEDKELHHSIKIGLIIIPEKIKNVLIRISRENILNQLRVDQYIK